jgi:hypothetical protein
MAQVQIILAKKQYLGKRGRHGIVAYTEEAGCWILKRDFAWDGIPVGFVEKIHKAKVINTEFWTYSKKTI